MYSYGSVRGSVMCECECRRGFDLRLENRVWKSSGQHRERCDGKMKKGVCCVSVFRGIVVFLICDRLVCVVFRLCRHQPSKECGPGFLIQEKKKNVGYRNQSLP